MGNYRDYPWFIYGSKPAPLGIEGNHRLRLLGNRAVFIDISA